MSAGHPEIIGVMRTPSQKVIGDLFALDRQAQAMEDRAMDRVERRAGGSADREAQNSQAQNKGQETMTGPAPAFSRLLAKELPPPAPRWAGFPTHNFVGGHNDPTQIPAAALAESATAVLGRSGSALALYNSDGPQGCRALREFVVRKVAGRADISCATDDVLITSGSGQGLDLVNRLLVEPGDTVLVEQFSYAGAISKLRRLKASIVEIPLDGDGLRTDALARTLEHLGRTGIVAKYIYAMPTIQNPTGSILTAERRGELVAIARRHGVPILEDECYGKAITGPQLKAAVEKVLADPSYRENARRLGDGLRAGGGYAKVADVIEAVAAGR